MFDVAVSSLGRDRKGGADQSARSLGVAGPVAVGEEVAHAVCVNATKNGASIASWNASAWPNHRSASS